MKPIALTINLLLISSIIFAQNFTKQFGMVTKEDIEYNECDFDRDADAVVLFNIGDVYFYDTKDGGYDIRFTETKRIKILKESGTEHAVVEIPYYVDGYGRTERIVSIEAYTYNVVDHFPERKAIEASQIYEEKISERLWLKKFTFPDVKAGSIIEYKYILESPFRFKLPTWRFQNTIPTLYSQYKARMIPFYEYIYIAQGIEKFDYQTSAKDETKRSWGNTTKAYGKNVGGGVEFQDFVHTFVMHDVPAFKDESYITSTDDYLIKMEFQLAEIHLPQGGSKILTTWEDMNKDLQKETDFGKYLKACKKYAKTVIKDEINLTGKTDSEKAKILTVYVKQNFNHNGFYSVFSDKSAKKFFKQKTGNSAAMNLFLAALINEAGITAYPVIISNRDHGKISMNYPFLHFFNNVIVLVESDTRFLLDATEKNLHNKLIPPKCINEVGMAVKKKEPQWIKLTKSVPSASFFQIELSPKPDEMSMAVDMTYKSTFYEAYNLRNLLSDDEEELKDEFKENINKINTIELKDADETDKALIIKIMGDNEIERFGNTFIVAPFLNLAFTENKLKEPTRSYPVDFVYPRQGIFQIRIAVPEGYKPAELPDAYNMDNKLAAIQLKYSLNGDYVEIIAKYDLKQAVYKTEDYGKIRAYLNIIVDKFNQELVFEKA